MESALLDVVFDRLVADDGVSDEARDIVLAACEGPDALSERLSGEAAPRLSPARDGSSVEGELAAAYLRSVTVEGFRGVGPVTTLEVEPGPGLTLVVGRNGSGKSSFAEALELLLTGDSWRWRGRSQVWSEAWRNLHHSGATAITAELAVEGQPGPTVARREWDAGAELEDSTAWVQHHGRPRQPLAALGWSTPLDTYRPFLSYNELGSMLDEGPSKLYDAVSAVLGLEELVAAERLLRDARLPRERAAKQVKADLARLLERLSASADERAARCYSALSGRTWDLDIVEGVLAGGLDAPGPRARWRCSAGCAASRCPRWSEPECWPRSCARRRPVWRRWRRPTPDGRGRWPASWSRPSGCMPTTARATARCAGRPAP
jgi:energy-coupling factor transporter ATP-binding protein EcfA2